MFTKFLADESGLTGIEYALIAASISIVISPVVALLGPKLFNTYLNVTGVL